MDGVTDERLCPLRCEEVYMSGDRLHGHTGRCDFLKEHKGLHFTSGDQFGPMNHWWGIHVEYCQEVEQWTA